MLMIESNLPLTLFIFDKESRAGTFIGILASVFNSKKLKTTSAKLKYFQFLGSSHSNNPYVTKSDFCWKISNLQTILIACFFKVVNPLSMVLFP